MPLTEQLSMDLFIQGFPKDLYFNHCGSTVYRNTLECVHAFLKSKVTTSKTLKLRTFS